MSTATATKPNLTWAEAGPEIERHGIDLTRVEENAWMADCPGPRWKRLDAYGTTALEAVTELLREIGGVDADQA